MINRFSLKWLSSILVLLLLTAMLPFQASTVQAEEGLTFEKVIDLKSYDQYKVLDDAIYGYKGNTLKKLAVNGKDVEWQVTLEKGSYSGPIFVHGDGSVFVGTTTEYLASYDSNGIFLKNYKVPGTGVFHSVKVSDSGEVFVVRNDTNDYYSNKSLYAIRTNGTFKWKSDSYLSSYSNAYIIRIVEDQLLIQKSSYLYWISITDGKTTTTGDNGYAQYLDLHNSNVYAVNGRYVYSYSLNGKGENWSTSFENNIYSVSLNEDGTHLYVSSNSGAFYAFDVETQEVIWKFDEGTPNWGRAVQDNEGNILVPQTNTDVNLHYLYKFSQEGEQLDVTELPASADIIYKREDGSFYYISGTTLYSSSTPTPSAELVILTSDTTNIELPIKQTKAIKLSGVFSDGTTQDITSFATYSSSHSAIASVSGGVIKAVKEGQATITASYKGFNFSINVKVTPAEPEVTSLTANITNMSLNVGEEKAVFVEALLSNGTKKDVTNLVTWKTTTDVISVNGVNVKGLKEGQSVLTGTYQNKAMTIPVTVTKKVLVHAPEVFKTTHNFSTLVSNIELFNEVLGQYTPDELKVIVPDKYIVKITSNHTPDILTNLDIVVGNNVRSVEVNANGQTKEAKRIKTDAYNIAWAGLKKGAELVIVAKDAKGVQLEKKILRLKEGTSVIEAERGDVESGNYSLLYLISNPTVFNKILDKFSLTELNVGVPMRYITDVRVESSVYSTKFTVQTEGTFAKVTIVTADGTEYPAQSNGNGVYVRDISGLKAGDSVTVRVYDEGGRILQEKPAFVD